MAAPGPAQTKPRGRTAYQPPSHSALEYASLDRATAAPARSTPTFAAVVEGRS